MPASRKYTQRHFRDIAALLAAERAEHGPSPALSRITAAFTVLFAEDSRADATAGNPRHFDPVLFGRAARGEVSPTAQRQRRRRPGPADDREAAMSAVQLADALRKRQDIVHGGMTGQPITPHNQTESYQHWARGSGARLLAGSSAGGTILAMPMGGGSPFPVPLGCLDPAPAMFHALGEADYVIVSHGTVIAWHLGPEVSGVSSADGEWIEVAGFGPEYGRFHIPGVREDQDALHAALRLLAPEAA
jgi:hypothetical protein